MASIAGQRVVASPAGKQDAGRPGAGGQPVHAAAAQDRTIFGGQAADGEGVGCVTDELRFKDKILPPLLLTAPWRGSYVKSVPREINSPVRRS